MGSILNSTPHGIWVWDGFGRVIAVNKMAETYGAVHEKALIGKCYLQLIRDGLYDRSVAHEIFRTKRPAVIRSKSLRTGLVTRNFGTPHVDERGEVYRIVVTETRVDQAGGDACFFDDEKVGAGLKEAFLDPESVRVGSYEVVARSDRYRNTLKKSFSLAEKGVSRILILGESGSGKGLLARLIHEKSPRSSHAFVQINCAAVPENLLEAELFGYEGGAFTGARSQGKAGLLEKADGGTIFLDEIGEMPLSLQAKLLKYLDDFQVTRLGGTREQKVDCTLVAATNCDLAALVKAGRFREDLFYRINAFTVTIPPLRERPEDIPGLLDHYLSTYNQRFGTRYRMSPLLTEQLQLYRFPGNVRELKNITKRVVVLGEAEALDESLGAFLTQKSAPAEPQNLKGKILAFERGILKKALGEYPTTRALAQHLGIDQSSVVRKLKKHGLRVNGGKGR